MKSQDFQESHNQEHAIVTSPFNGVKLELGIALCLGIVLWLAADSITASLGKQLVLFITYGLVSAIWLVIRTRQVVRQFEQDAEN